MSIGTRKKIFYYIAIIFNCTILFQKTVTTGEKLLIELKNFSHTELKSGGFSAPKNITIHIKAQGGGSEKSYAKEGLFAYGWILNSDTREKVWEMTKSNTFRKGKFRYFDDYIDLPAGSYEVYFTCPVFKYKSTFINVETNINHRKGDEAIDWGINNEFIVNLFEDLFGDDINKEFRHLSKNYGLEIYTDSEINVLHFNPPIEFQNILFKAVALGDNKRIRQAFNVTQPINVKIYALGEVPKENQYSDYGFILDSRTRKRIWEMSLPNLKHAGGGKKNKIFNDNLTLQAGSYILYYYTDDSHSFEDWNDLPPYDPFNYGITIYTTSESDKKYFHLTSLEKENNIIVAITKVEDNEFLEKTFTLKKDLNVRVYAIGERYPSRRQMADYGWIIDAKTREKIWEMDIDRTNFAGGNQKNRMIDEVIFLKRGTYIVFYKTDDSHSYKNWNTNPPYDEENYGITLFALDAVPEKDFVQGDLEKDKNIISQIVKVGNNLNKSSYFKISEPTRVRIYALGEGFKNQMFDYGWIEDANTGKIIWEMTYSMTFHAGGSRKNRMVNTTLFLDTGEYRLRYKSDDSHSYNSWNEDPPEDAIFWGITLYKE